MDSLSIRSRTRHGNISDGSDSNIKISNINIFEPVRSNKMAQKSLISKLSWKFICTSLLLWIILINYNERSVVKRTFNKCQWAKWEEWKKGDPHRIALFADPQIMDAYSYPGRPAIVNYFARRIIDNYHKRNWAFSQDILNADTTIFLGDLFDGGRNWDDAEWFNEFERFNQIYYKPPNKRTIMSLPGNHDIGFGETVNVTSLQRFKAVFGPTSTINDIANHTIVLLDSISLSDFSNPEVMAHPRSILESLDPELPNESPRILISHVPLFRDHNTQTCGPLRESKKKFPIMKGLQYQTVIENDLSLEILSKVRPSIAFSGDDHDYCHVIHTYDRNGKRKTAQEITVKSCSMNMGIKYPAIQLLSLNTEDASSPETYKTQICYLPAPYAALKSYVSLAIVNFIFGLVIFLLPEVWGLLTTRLTIYIKRNQMNELPIAGQTKSSDIPLIAKDYSAFGLNATVLTIGILLTFNIYYNAL